MFSNIEIAVSYGDSTRKYVELKINDKKPIIEEKIKQIFLPRTPIDFATVKAQYYDREHNKWSDLDEKYNELLKELSLVTNPDKSEKVWELRLIDKDCESTSALLDDIDGMFIFN
ncbi:unnamed protein product [Didymodactylos carnosus]|uniref:Uncharacterized protein n=1 Tax=Didymodactylos carnosus TaxID=1234261 RepID=A0A814X1B8_9BILA|nr:unnamed protein product [Didymodactylos carnosus]CAF3972295.1 unnamed protein product [Didymodactylos carnosus]